MLSHRRYNPSFSIAQAFDLVDIDRDSFITKRDVSGIKSLLNCLIKFFLQSIVAIVL